MVISAFSLPFFIHERSIEVEKTQAIFLRQSFYRFVGFADPFVGPVKEPAATQVSFMIDGIICQKGELNAGKMSEDFFTIFSALHQFFLPIIVGIHVIGADIKENPGGSERIPKEYLMCLQG